MTQSQQYAHLQNYLCAYMRYVHISVFAWAWAHMQSQEMVVTVCLYHSLPIPLEQVFPCPWCLCFLGSVKTSKPQNPFVPVTISVGLKVQTGFPNCTWTLGPKLHSSLSQNKHSFSPQPSTLIFILLLRVCIATWFPHRKSEYMWVSQLPTM